jgi:hypothetical protein
MLALSLEGFGLHPEGTRRTRPALPSLTSSCLCRCWALARPLSLSASRHPEQSEGFAFRLSPLRAPSFNAFNSCSPLPFKIPAFKPSNLQTPLSVSPFPATLTSHCQLAENKTTLSLAVATLTDRVKHKSFVCHSYRKHPGWGYTFQFKFFSFLNSTTHHSLLSTISFRIRTSKTQHLKPFRIRTYEKTPGGRTSLLTASGHHLKPLLRLAHPYLCTCKKGPAARGPRYSTCAAF